MIHICLGGYYRVNIIYCCEWQYGVACNRSYSIFTEYDKVKSMKQDQRVDTRDELSVTERHYFGLK